MCIDIATEDNHWARPHHWHGHSHRPRAHLERSLQLQKAQHGFCKPLMICDRHIRGNDKDLMKYMVCCAKNRAAQDFLSKFHLLEGVVCITQKSTLRIEHFGDRRVRTQVGHINDRVLSHQWRRAGRVLIISRQILRLSATNSTRICGIVSLPSRPETIKLTMEEQE